MCLTERLVRENRYYAYTRLLGIIDCSMKNKELKEKIYQALLMSKFKWRTAKGISKEVNASYEEVFKVLKNSDKVIQAKKSNSKGQALFALRDKYTSESSFGTRLINALTNKIH